MENNPISNEQLAELNRLHEAATKGMNWQEVAQFQAMITEQYQPLRQRLLAAESRLRAVVNDLGEVLVDVRRQRDAATARAEAAEKEALDYIDYRNQAVIIRNAMERRLEAAESLVAGLRVALEEAKRRLKLAGQVPCSEIHAALALTPASAVNRLKAEALMATATELENLRNHIQEYIGPDDARDDIRRICWNRAKDLRAEADRLIAEAEKEAANG